MVSMPLIAQLGRNFNSNLPFGISGSDLLSMALQRVLDVEYVIGGKTVYIECNNQPKLFDFYSSSGFLAFDKRNRQGSVNKNDVLIQKLAGFVDPILDQKVPGAFLCGLFKDLLK